MFIPFLSFYTYCSNTIFFSDLVDLCLAIALPNTQKGEQAALNGIDVLAIDVCADKAGALD